MSKKDPSEKPENAAEYRKIPGKRRRQGSTGQYLEKLEEQEITRRARKNPEACYSGFRVLRAGNENRTRDLRTTNATHYRLCYASILFVAVFATNEYYHV